MAGLSLAHFAGELDLAADAPEAAALLRAGAARAPESLMAGALELYEQAGDAVSVELLRLDALQRESGYRGGQASLLGPLREDALLRQAGFAERAAALREALGRPPSVAGGRLQAAAALAAGAVGGGGGAECSGNAVVWVAATAAIRSVAAAEMADGFVVEWVGVAGGAASRQLLLAPTAQEAAEWAGLLAALVKAAAADS